MRHACACNSEQERFCSVGIAMRLSKALHLVYLPVLLVWAATLGYRYREALARHGRRGLVALQNAPVRDTLSMRTLPPWTLPARNRIGAAPEWCTELMERPRERERVSSIYDCGRGRFGAVCNDSRPRFFGQYNQDLFTWRMRQMNQYESRTPTFFDACLGWTGVCVEANPRYYDVLRRWRRCALVQRCVGNETGLVTFIDEQGLSGIEATNKNAHAWSRNGVLHKRPRIEVACVRTRDALAPLAITKIDFLSLDVEGHELHVLRGIDWKATKVNVIVVENVTNELYTFLIEKGYQTLTLPRLRQGKVGGGELWSD
eukprot:IDg9852t1